MKKITVTNVETEKSVNLIISQQVWNTLRPVYDMRNATDKASGLMPHLTPGQAKKVLSLGNVEDSYFDEYVDEAVESIVDIIEGNGGFDNFRRWSTDEIATWVRNNYDCSARVARVVANRIK